MNVSVAMAVYNGERYIKEQINSILPQLTENDELVISYNKSNDNTINILNNYRENDKRVKVFLCDEKGVIRNFENALNHCKNEIIILSDQDDVWYANKVTVIIDSFKKYKKANVVIHDADIYIQNENKCKSSLFQLRNAKSGLIHNLIKNSYTGCCMAIRRDFLKYCIPFPKKINMHDQWIGLMSDLYDSSLFIDDKLIKYRRHENNVTNSMKNSIFMMIKIRLRFLVLMIKEFLKKLTNQ